MKFDNLDRDREGSAVLQMCETLVVAWHHEAGEGLDYSTSLSQDRACPRSTITTTTTPKIWHVYEPGSTRNEGWS